MATLFHVGAPPVLAAVVAEDMNATNKTSPLVVVKASECGSVVPKVVTPFVL